MAKGLSLPLMVLLGDGYAELVKREWYTLKGRSITRAMGIDFVDTIVLVVYTSWLNDNIIHIKASTPSIYIL